MTNGPSSIGGKILYCAVMVVGTCATVAGFLVLVCITLQWQIDTLKSMDHESWVTAFVVLFTMMVDTITLVALALGAQSWFTRLLED